MTDSQPDDDTLRRARVFLAPLVPLVPTVSGVYMDRTQDEWTLNADGTWTDHEGVTKSAEHNWKMAMNLPLTPLDVWLNT